MPSVFCKYQKCGKLNCRCQKGAPHGPYFWLIMYLRKTSETSGKYRWTYLGKTPTSAITRLKDLVGNTSISNHLTMEIEEKGEKTKQKALQKLLRTQQRSVTVKLIEF
ncbi:MAG: DUF6788 family protein [Candidatus Odinarchaeota archaeon]